MNYFLDCEFTCKKNIAILRYLILHEIDFYPLAFHAVDINNSPKNAFKLGKFHPFIYTFKKYA